MLQTPTRHPRGPSGVLSSRPNRHLRQFALQEQDQLAWFAKEAPLTRRDNFLIRCSFGCYTNITPRATFGKCMRSSRSRHHCSDAGARLSVVRRSSARCFGPVLLAVLPYLLDRMPEARRTHRQLITSTQTRARLLA